MQNVIIFGAVWWPRWRSCWEGFPTASGVPERLPWQMESKPGGGLLPDSVPCFTRHHAILIQFLADSFCGFPYYLPMFNKLTRDIFHAWRVWLQMGGYFEWKHIFALLFRAHSQQMISLLDNPKFSICNCCISWDVRPKNEDDRSLLGVIRIAGLSFFIKRASN